MNLRTSILCALVTLLAACSPRNPTTQQGGASQSKTQAPVVRTAPVELRQVRREIATTGFLESEHQVTVLSKIQGRVVSVLVDEGAKVAHGQTLAQLDQREADTTLTQIEVQMEDKKVRLELQKLEVDSSARRIVQASNDRARAEAEYRRNADMDPTLISPKIVQDSKYAFENADETLRVAEFTKRKAVLDVQAAENAIRELAAKTAETKLKIAEHTITAPLDGVVSKRSIKGGETIGQATELFVVTDLDNLVCYLARPQRELPLVQQSRQVAFTVDGYDKEFTADVDLVSPVIDQATGSFKLRLRVRKDDASALRPGMFIRARILTELMREALMVPKAAVLADGEFAVLFAVRNGQAHKITLDAGLEEKAFVECRNRGDDGLAPNELVVVSGQQDLKDKMPVEVQQASIAPAKAAEASATQAGAAK